MITQIKYLVFKGIEKKEQILFKSFLNLAKNELDYQVVILKEGHGSADDPDIVILSEQYEFADNEKELVDLPTILVGSDVQNNSDSYILRPVQWSDFKLALLYLDINVVENNQPIERVLSSDIKFAISDVGSREASNSIIEQEPKVNDNLSMDSVTMGYGLGEMSLDYQSYTNNDYVKVVDDVKLFKGDSNVALHEAIILMTDDESGSSNSVLIIETEAHEAWDLSPSEASVSDYLESKTEEGHDEVRDVVLERKIGLRIASDEEYWLEENEIIVDHETLFYIKPARGIVYSASEPCRWTKTLQRGDLSKLPLGEGWQPSENLTGYPLSHFIWTNTLINETSNLANGLDEREEYMLEKWPHFDLLELDNILLRLCTMMFVRPETVKSLSSKSGYGRSTVVGLMNACHTMGLIKPASDFIDKKVVSNAVAVSNDGVFGKLKNVFR